MKYFALVVGIVALILGITSLALYLSVKGLTLFHVLLMLPTAMLGIIADNASKNARRNKQIEGRVARIIGITAIVIGIVIPALLNFGK